MSGSEPGQWLTYAEQGGLEAYCVTATAPSADRRGTVLLLQEIFGVNAAMQVKAEFFASKGFDVVIPDLFSRQERRVNLAYDEADRKRGFQLLQNLDRPQAVTDCVAAARWARQRPHSNGRLAVVGFCIGGLVALQLAAQFPCDAAISFYGVNVHENLDIVHRISSPLQYHVGDKDAHISASSVAAISAAIDAMPNGEVFVYPGAGHGFFNPMRQDVYDPKAFETAATRVVGLFRQRLQ